MELNKIDSEIVINRYTERYKKYGYDPKTLGWDKGKQDLRFSILTSQFDLDGKSICDIGCGFGDLNNYLKLKTGGSYLYFGIDIVESLINEAKNRYTDNDIQFKTGDFLKEDIPEFDYTIASGIFNFKLQNEDNYTYIENVINKAFSISKIGLAFEFLSDKVDFEYDYTFHSSPEKILSIAYKYTRNIILRNDYMPFEFTIFLFKDDSFKREDTIFTSYKNKLMMINEKNNPI
jgi:ubiquinone/menaquinone biosynthesis C-methylase UbiE